jgi:DNA primase
MFPIHDESGKVIAFGGRALREDDQPKYRNSSETAIYRKSSVLYNLHRARDGMRKSNRAILVEGYMDVIGVYAAGIKEVVASCGTSLTAAQVGVMHRHSDTVVINFDPDNAGVNAAEKAIHLLLDEGLHVRVLALDGGLDPDEYVKQNGAELYRARLDSASGYFHWLADRARIKYDMSSVDGRMDAFKLLLMPAVQKLSDRLERAAVVNDLAGYLGVDKGEVLDQFKKAAADRRAPAAVSTASRVEIPALERILFNALLISAAVRDDVLPRLDQAALDGFVTREIFETLKNLVNSGGQVGFSALNERLTGAAQGLLHDLTTADEILDEEDARAKADACMRRLESERRKRHLAGLKARVAAAQREGQTEEARSLAMELMRAENTAHQGGSSKW